jgi:hypothetical protein
VTPTGDGDATEGAPVTASDDAKQPEPGTDSRVEDWFGQSVERDADLADRLSSELGEADAERQFEAQSRGRDEQDARRGDYIDPDQGRSAYQEDAP